MAVDQEFVDQYTDLLIKQYWDQPKARQTVEALASEYSKVFDFYDAFKDEFDLDKATGDRLDIIGKIVGIQRNIPLVLQKIQFGFEGDATARGFDDLYQSVNSAPFNDIFEPDYTATQLNDDDYRFFIKAKISKNITSSFMVSDDRVTLQEVIFAVFDGQAYIVDKQDMSLILYVPYDLNPDVLRIVQALDLLPSPQGVGYKIFIAGQTDSFGFEDDPNAKGFGDLFDPNAGGSFAEFYNLA